MPLRRYFRYRPGQRRGRLANLGLEAAARGGFTRAKTLLPCVLGAAVQQRGQFLYFGTQFLNLRGRNLGGARLARIARVCAARGARGNPYRQIGAGRNPA